MPAARIHIADIRDRVLDRFETIALRADAFLASGLVGTEATREVYLDEAALSYAVEAYFLLSDAYKQVRTDPESPTQPPKMAALSALVFEKFRPFRPLHPERPRKLRISPHANRLFSLDWAEVLLEQDLREFYVDGENKDKLVRYFRVLRATELNSLQSYWKDVKAGRKAAYYDILLDHDAEDNSVNIAGKPSRLSDMPHIDTMILIFELLWKPSAVSNG